MKTPHLSLNLLAFSLVRRFLSGLLFVLGLTSSAFAAVTIQGSGYAGLNYSQTGGYVPPASCGAAGNSIYIETANQEIAIYSPKATGASTVLDSMSHFFFTTGGLTPASGSSSLTGPTMVYDELIGRFIVGDLDVDFSSHVSNFVVAVSKTGNPTTLTASDWTFYVVTTTENVSGGANNNYDADYAGNAGYNADAFVFTVDMFAGAAFEHAQVVAVNAADLAAGVAQASLHTFRSDPAGIHHPRPTAMHGSASGDPMWLVTEHGDNVSIDVIRMANVLTSSPVFTTTNLAVTPYAQAVPPLNPDGSQVTPAANIDSRILKAAAANNTLVATHHVASSATEDVARWYAIDVSSGTPALTQQGNVAAGVNTYLYFPAIDIDPAGGIGMTYLRSGTDTTTDFMSVYVTGRLPGENAGTMETPVLVPAGTGQANYSDYAGGRVGSLSGINIDPGDGSFWVVNEFATSAAGAPGAANWGTAIANFTLSKSNPTLSLTPSSNPAVVGQSVTFTATLTTASGTPTGSVTFGFGDGTPDSTVPLTGNMATVNHSFAAKGGYTIDCSYSGDSSFNTATKGASETVNPDDTTTRLTSSMNPSDFGHSVTFTATVSANAPGAGTPAGMITFLDGTSTIGTSTLSGSGMASLSTSALAVGSHTITASYAGDGDFNGSTGALNTNPQMVFTADTTTTVTSSMNPSDFGHSVTFTIHVTPSGMGVATGTVSLLDGNSTIASGTLDSNGMASLSTSALAVGNHTISASYSGDSNFAPSTGTLSNNPQMVFTADTITTVTSSVNPSIVGQEVMFTATVTLAPGGTGNPTGSVLFDFGDGTSSTISLSTGVAHVDHTFMSIGNFTITGSYSGDTNFNASSNTVSGGQVVKSGSGGTYSSNPAPGSRLDFGGVAFVSHTPDNFVDPVKRSLDIINSGSSDLPINSISLKGEFDFDPSVAIKVALTRPDGSFVTTLPAVIPPNSDLKVTLIYHAAAPAGEVSATLTVTSGDPATPMANYDLVGHAVESAQLSFGQELAIYILNLAKTATKAESLNGQPQKHAESTASQTVTLTFDSTQTQNLTTDIPDFLGGGSTKLTGFAGSLTVTALPIPADNGHMALRIESGTMTAPSFKTPNGQDTGVNKLTFGSPDASGGTLNLSDGSYTAFAQATITNDLIPGGVLVRGTYSGTYNSQTKQVTSNSKSSDILTVNARPLNISTRLAVGTGENALIGGFIITGNAPKRVIIRGLGPSLQANGAPVPGRLADPSLELYQQGNTVPIETNDNWVDSPNKQAIIDTTIPPSDDSEPAIIRSLDPGAYTAVLRGVGDTTGVGLVEVYDLDPTADTKLAQISTRGLVQTDNNVMIGGFIIGAGPASKVLVRAIGPSLADRGVQGALSDPRLELHDKDGVQLASNDNWKTDDVTGDSQEAAITATTVPPSNDLESALLGTFPPGNYTAVVRGANDAIGVALVEVYNLGN